jgi:hypothetical protein
MMISTPSNWDWREFKQGCQGDRSRATSCGSTRAWPIGIHPADEIRNQPRESAEPNQNPSVERLRKMDRRAGIVTTNEEATLRIRPCVARSSHFYRAKFIP